MEQKGISADRVCDASGISVGHLECSICHDLLRKPIACQSCETPFCSVCIYRWLIANPNNCPNQCETFVERKCPPFIAKLLSQLHIACYYQSKGCPQIISYEALDKHESECDYQPQQCPGCRLQILKKDFHNHTKNCASVGLTCQDCCLVYKRVDTATKHTDNICLSKQLRQLRGESKQNKQELHKLTNLWDKMCKLSESYNVFNADKKTIVVSDPEFAKVTIKFDDLPSVSAECKNIPSIYRGLAWNKISYMDKSYAVKTCPKSGYVTSFDSCGSVHIAYLKDEASISIESTTETFTLISLDACAAWKNDLELTITGHRNLALIDTHTVTLFVNRPQHILLEWDNIDKIIFKSSGGTTDPDSPTSANDTQVVINQLTIGLDL
ncbi:unnamed protein product [Rotaria socialis]|uniref:RING-type E3 ubiquitin transferase n=1 Tax=Rotaria socialis TaxID=392032 RepID=A0A818HLA4_9BILA|nr:unnamed protein product [Rotaria socialis]CAF3510456.1 unnamed protein product [Rotaria socialis]CAF4486966.1 unnamed protein product [Rotaria socialis]CAF4498283.1 unnamed protein product [Rotaria socialis]